MAGEEGRTGDDALGGRMKLLASKVDSKIFFHKDAVMEYMDMKHLIGDLVEEKARMEQEACRRLAAPPPELVLERLAAAKEELAATKEQLAAAKEELAATKEQLAAARAELDAAKEEIAVTKEQLAAAKVKVQEMEPMRNQDEQQSASVTGLDSVQCQTSVRKTRSMSGQQVAGHCAIGDDDLELLRRTLIKEFMELDCGGRILGVKEMGRLNRKPFHAACAAKLPPKEAEKAASKLYTTWEKLLKSPSWRPFKTVAVGDDHQEVIDVDDDTLQELKRTWGEGAHDAVFSTLMEMREYNRLSDRTITYELWNYKAGRKATTVECVEYMGNQVKQLAVAKRRKTRRTAGIA